MANKGGMQLKGVLILLLTAFIWGSSFVAQDLGMDNVDAFTFTCVRSFMGALFLLPVILIKDGVTGRRLDTVQKAERQTQTKKSLVCGAVLGVFLCAATNFQQFAFYSSSSGKISFITALYMFFVPLLGLFERKRLSRLTWASVALGFLGLFLLCVNPSDLKSVNRGDMLCVASAFFFALHILFVERFSPYTDGIKLSCVQFAVNGALSLVLMFVFENPSAEAIKGAVYPLLYSGIMSCGIAYTLQIIGQKYAEAAVASLLLCTESVFGLICGAVFLHERMSGKEIAGCAVMFFAIVLSQTAEKITYAAKRRKEKRHITQS